MVGNNVDGAMWMAEKGAREKTKAEAQALIDAEVTAGKEVTEVHEEPLYSSALLLILALLVLYLLLQLMQLLKFQQVVLLNLLLYS